MVCKNCGSSLPEGSLYCPVCGMINEQENISGSDKCPSCGARIEPGSVYCGECGARIDTQNTSNAGWDRKTVYNAPNTGYTAKQEISENDTYKQTSKEGGSGNTVTVLIIIIITLIVLIATGAIGFMIYVNSDNEPAERTSSQSEQVVTAAPATVAPVTPTPATAAPQAEIPQVAPPASRTAQSDGYYYPSNSRYITVSELDSMTPSEIRLILNEMYARHGYIFSSQDYQNYFSAKSWYIGTTTSQDEVLKYFNAYEMANRQTIVDYELAHGLR